jgi:dTDP-4-dehydrorhamnose reductase
MLRLGKERDQLSVVADQIGTPTNAADLAKAILTILPKIKNEDVEIFHYSNEGVCSWYDFAKSIFETSGIQIKMNPIDSSLYPTPAKRPFYSVLNKGKIKKKYGLDIPYWKDSLMFVLNTSKCKNGNQ